MNSRWYFGFPELSRVTIDYYGCTCCVVFLGTWKMKNRERADPFRGPVFFTDQIAENDGSPIVHCLCWVDTYYDTHFLIYGTDMIMEMVGSRNGASINRSIVDDVLAQQIELAIPKFLERVK